MERSNEDRLDFLAEMMEPAAAIFGDPEIQALAKSGAAPIKYAKPAIKNHKREIITILAALEEEDLATYRVPAPGVFFLKVISLFSKPEIKALFTSQSQQSDNGSSGSATGNIRDGVK